jgi:hypothetical protein
VTVVSQVSKRRGVIGAVAAVVLIFGTLGITRAASNGTSSAVPSDPSILREGEVLEVGDDGVSLVATDTSTRNQRPLARCADCFFAFRKFSASVDGRWIAYSSIVCHLSSCGGAEPAGGIWVAGAAGSPMLVGGSWVWAWSTTDQLAFVGDSTDGTELTMLDPSTGERTSIVTTKGGIPALAWSPDGSTIAYVANTRSEPSKSSVFVVRPRGTPERIEGPSVLFSRSSGWGALDAMNGLDALVWSPDGTRLALSTSRDGLIVLPIDGSGGRTIIHGHPGSFAWSPDGRQIAFVARGDDVVIVPASGGPPVLHGSDTFETIDRLEADRWIQGRVNWFRGFGGSVVWSPDGRVVAFTRGNHWKAVSA